MNLGTRSYEKVHYEFRPAKQVERRMLIHAFQQLMTIGFPIADYQYTGFGSIYFVDFIMFHRYLNIIDMVSVERDDIETRLKFNKPFKSIQLYMGEVGDYVASFSQDKKHILWLDYDNLVQRSMIQTVTEAASRLSVGSILLITVDTEPPGSSHDGPKKWRDYFIDQAAEYLKPRTSIGDFAKSNLPKIIANIFDKALRDGVAMREGTDFFPLFNFVYADGHHMLSIGGMIGTNKEKTRLRSLSKKRLPFLRFSLIDEPYEISVPLLTRKERLHLDSEMPCRKGWVPKSAGISSEHIEEYKKIYKYYPAYTEMLL